MSSQKGRRHQAGKWGTSLPLVTSTVKDEIKDCIERDAIRWKCSESWIIATALAAFYDIDLHVPFEKVNYNKKKNVVKVEPLKFKKRA